MNIINYIMHSFLRRRIKQIDYFRQHPIEVQDRTFTALIRAAENTAFGKQYGYKEITKWETFNNRVPICTYEELKPYVDRIIKGEKNVLWNTPIQWMAQSSGTTSERSKLIPISKESLHDCHFKGGTDMLALYCDNHPNSRMFSGANLALGGSEQTNSLDNKNIFCADLSAILIDNLPFWAEYFRTPSKKTALLGEWEEKLEKIVLSSYKRNVVSLSGVPSWMMLVLQHALAYTGKSDIKQIWPNLEVYFHGGVAFTPYRSQFDSIISQPMNYMETYNASEGFFGIQDRSDSDALLLLLDYGVFYEFIPMDEIESASPSILPLSQIKIGTNYAMLISTNGGLWRYMIGDTVRFSEIAPYRFKITGRSKSFINACGEEVIVDNANKALAAACLKTNASIDEYTAAPLFDYEKHLTLHQWVVEFSHPPSDMELFISTLDQELQAVNSDYEVKRYKNFILQRPEVIVAPKGTFYEWMKQRGKLGGQNKVPRLSNDRQYIDEILKHIPSIS